MMGDRPHVVVIHRWRARYAEYARYVDHRRTAVTYVSTEVGASAVPAGAAGVALVPATDDLPSVADRVKQLAVEHGQPSAIVALKEDDLLVAAQLRREWGCPGPRPEQVLPFRDKLAMAGAVAGAGLAVPAFVAARDADEIRAFADRHGWPVVVKPRLGSSSAGVARLDGPADAERVEFAGETLMVQAFDPRQIYHVDGYFDGARLGPYRASRYVNDCLGFRTGTALGSVEEDDPDLVAAIGAFTARVMAALTGDPSVFHLEVFVDPGRRECAFLEVGARVGGAEIPFLWREVHGYDLMETAFRLQLGRRARPWSAAASAPRGEVAGWLLAPAPAARPCRITEATSMLGRDPGPYAEALLRPGEVLPAADAYYEHVGGRFRFRGACSADVAAAIAVTARDFRVAAEPL
ncbi:biotin carboxylase [Micromonospora sp. B11E3]|uniref:ATP-grasp domain-containing protein n=1 Tax=Micromonospora sp. B11E3 TaxID=3153562 RepID=UPI00325D72B9